MSDTEADDLRRQLRTRIPQRRTICEVHREMYDHLEASGADEKIIGLLEEAYAMAKRMHLKLVQYKEGYDRDWYDWETQKAKDEKLALRSKRT